MKNKKWILILIIAFPSMFWLILETSKINSRKLPHYGLKKINNSGDTIFQEVTTRFYKQDTLFKYHLTNLEVPIYAIIFINQKYRGDSYRLAGLWEFLNYKKQKIEHIPFILVTETENLKSQAYEELKTLNKSKNVFFYSWQKSSFDSLTKSYFIKKPIYIDYSFFVLVDGKRNIRGYYDGRYVSEIKRLIEEYQHLRIKEEKNKLINQNEIKKNY